ncbi:PLP-dependent aminotransferase family protein [Ancylobacter dichloromethanicus]|uniref:MocR-like pyridoxine biosynthesis transcription factor PdxR n=1 Tax=Ancylobacter dichloromethanicus TaxID=518825 RepID=UPI0022F2E944|nr:PLP-dependent aminotransferase family protein [Ancylobacter dichloromethanicus]
MLLDALGLNLERRPDSPLYRQIYQGLAAEIVSGAIKPGQRLPSTRDLAQSLGVSRNTIMLAFEQLAAEGYLEGLSGSGTYVSRQPPAEVVEPAAPRINPAIRAAGSLDRSAELGVAIEDPEPEGARPDFGGALAHAPQTLRHMRRPVPFRSNFPALDAFPVQLWAKLAADLYRKLDADTANHLMGEGDPQGYAPLREAIARHVSSGRGIDCSADNVIVFAGAQQAIDLACRLLLMPEDEVICEDPGYDGIYASTIATGATPVPVAVDGDGLDVERALARAPHARMAYVSPSKQFPLGMSLSLERRHALVDWAQRTGSWIIEDDYDSEFRYAGRPLPALYALDRGRHVLYLGTFSKTLFPALRLGFAIVPAPLVEAFVSARTVVGRYSPILEQVLVARFMQEGHFASHVRKMRKLYAQRQAHLLARVGGRLGDFMTAQPTDTGMEIVARLAPGLSARALAKAAARAGLEIMPLSALARHPDTDVDDYITLGFSPFAPRQIDEGVERLRKVLVDMRGGAAPATAA